MNEKNVEKLIVRLATEAQLVLFEYNSDFSYKVRINRMEAMIEGFTMALEDDKIVKFENRLDMIGVSLHALRHVMSLPLADRLSQIEYYNDVKKRY